MGKFDFKIAVVSSVMAFAGIGLLVQCAPKKSEAPSAGKQAKVHNYSNVVEGIDFTKLEASSDNAAKAVHRTLKDKAMPEPKIIALAVAEQHLKIAKEPSDNPSAIKLILEITEYVSKSKITKMSEFRLIYDTLEASKSKKVKTGNQSNNIVGVLKNAEISAYSGPLLIATAWLDSSVSSEKAVAIISSGKLKLGEIGADQKVSAFLATEKGTNLEELGKLEELAKKGNVRIIPLKLFLVHESLKAYAADPHQWATKILNTAANELNYKISPEAVIASTHKADAAKIEESVLLNGKLTDLPDSTLPELVKDVKPAAAGAPAAEGTPAAAGAPVAAGAAPVVAGVPGLTTEYEFKINGAAKSYAEFQKLLAGAQKNSLLAIVKRHFTIDKKKLSVKKKELPQNSSIVLARVEKFIDSDIQLVGTLGQEVTRDLEAALKEIKDKKVESIILVQVKTAKDAKLYFVNEIANKDKADEIGLNETTEVVIKPELTDLLLKLSAASRVDSNNIIAIEIVTKEKK